MKVLLIVLTGLAILSDDPRPESIGPWEPLELATGGGERGPWRQNESRFDYVDDATVAMDGRGGVAVAWVDQRQKDVLFQRIGPGEARPSRTPVNVSRSPAVFSWLPRIATAAPCHVFVLWQEIIFSGGSHGGDILFARSHDGGATFEGPVNLSSSPGGDGKGRINRESWDNGSLDIAAGEDGRVYAAWTEYHGALWFSQSEDFGRTFSAPSRLAGDEARPARAPSLALGPEGAVHLAWTYGEDSAADIHLSSSRDHGKTFADPRVVMRTEGYSDAPKIAVDSRGIVHLAYAEILGGPFGRPHVRYTVSDDAGEAFHPSRDLSGQATGERSAGFPALSVVGERDVFVLWEVYPDEEDRPRGLALMRLRDGDVIAPATPVPASRDPAGGTNGSHQGMLTRKLAVGAGGIAVVNSSLQPGVRSRVWLMRSTKYSHLDAMRGDARR
jgi:hypothetical protein